MRNTDTNLKAFILALAFFAFVAILVLGICATLEMITGVPIF